MTLPFQGNRELHKGFYQSSFLNDHDFLITSYSKLKFSLKKPVLLRQEIKCLIRLEEGDAFSSALQGGTTVIGLGWERNGFLNTLWLRIEASSVPSTLTLGWRCDRFLEISERERMYNTTSTLLLTIVALGAQATMM